MEINRIDLNDVLRLYFNFEHDYHEAHKTLCDKYYHSVRRREVFRPYSEKYNVEARLGFVAILKTKTLFWMYVADKVIRKKGNGKANSPLHSIPDCEYMYYGLFMNCAAFINGATTSRLALVHSPTGKIIDFRYRPKMAEELLEDYLEKKILENQVILDL
jgi:hypothetical protein